MYSAPAAATLTVCLNEGRPREGPRYASQLPAQAGRRASMKGGPGKGRDLAVTVGLVLAWGASMKGGPGKGRDATQKRRR